ncbi:GNAT family N-acetyltransferase [Streptacidiphilus sp. PAMC 29251]
MRTDSVWGRPTRSTHRRGSLPGWRCWLRIPTRKRWRPAWVAATDGSSRATGCTAGSCCGTGSTTMCGSSATSATAIRPSSRRRGLAGWALGRILDEAWTLGLDRVLIVCEADNLGSMKTIEHRGGVLEGVQNTEHGPVRRYWTTAQ